MPKRGDREFILDMILATEKILKYTKNISYDDFSKNDMIVDAVVRNIEIIGEATKSI
jgi:uncharacterized protein with HEPN domain